MKTNSMRLHEEEDAVEAVISGETIEEAEVITSITNELRKHSDGQSMLPGKKPKTNTTQSLTTSHTSNLRAKLEKTWR
jgi:hypothetical protein